MEVPCAVCRMAVAAKRRYVVNEAMALLKDSYPQEVSESNFKRKLRVLRQTPKAKEPNLSVVYQNVGNKRVRLLCVGSMDRCAHLVVQLLDERPDYTEVKLNSEFIHVSPNRLNLY